MKTFKTFIILLMITLTFSLSGCVYRNSCGECIGLADKEKEGIEYTIRPINLIVGVLFFETVVVPAVVLLCCLKCPNQDSKGKGCPDTSNSTNY